MGTNWTERTYLELLAWRNYLAETMLAAEALGYSQEAEKAAEVLAAVSLELRARAGLGLPEAARAAPEA